jgi:hypothetical protein
MAVDIDAIRNGFSGCEECPAARSLLAELDSLRAENARLRGEAERLAGERDYFSAYAGDLAAIDRALDEIDAPHHPEDGASLSPRRIRELGSVLHGLRSEVACLTNVRSAAEALFHAEMQTVGGRFRRIEARALDALRLALDAARGEVGG